MSGIDYGDNREAAYRDALAAAWRVGLHAGVFDFDRLMLLDPQIGGCVWGCDGVAAEEIIGHCEEELTPEMSPDDLVDIGEDDVERWLETEEGERDLSAYLGEDEENSEDE
jgi:hypothetical protein